MTACHRPPRCRSPLTCPAGARLLLLVAAVGLAGAPGRADQHTFFQVQFSISATVPQGVFATPAVLQPALLLARAVNQPPVTMRCVLPTAVSRVGLLPYRLTLNGQPIVPLPGSSGGQPGDAEAALLFDAAQVSAILGEPGGLRDVWLEATVGGGHLLRAHGTVTLAIPAPLDHAFDAGPTVAGAGSAPTEDEPASPGPAPTRSAWPLLVDAIETFGVIGEEGWFEP